MKTVRIGNGCGFWGDNVDAPVRLARTGRLDYLTLEYLAELTMSILALLRQRNPQAGYAHDFLDVLDRLGPTLKEQPNLKVITNAGGMNPQACGEEAAKVLAKHGLANRKVGVVSGDDLLPRLDELIARGHALKHLDTGEPLSTVRSRVVSANAYLGAKPIAEALKLGASVVITGRVADASLAVGPAIHEFGWAWDDWNKLGVASVAGHLVECGAQMTGGLWPNVTDTHNLADVGYPIAEMTDAGGLRVTKPEDSGGAVNVETVSEQLLYEVADPARYFTPDVVGDFTAPSLREVAKDVVEITSCRGRPATDTYKVSIAYRDGFTAAGSLVIVGPNAVSKARKSGEILLARLKAAGHNYEHSYVEVLGGGDGVPGVFRPQSGVELADPSGRVLGRFEPTSQKTDPPEVVLRVAVRDGDKAVVERFTKEFAPLVTAGFAGTTGYTTGRPQVREVFAYWPTLVAKSAVTPVVDIR